MNPKCEFEHLSGQLTAQEIGLGWLDGLTLRKASMAVSMKPHWHRHVEVIFCLRGELTYEIDGFDPITLGADMGIAIPARRVHALKNNSESPSERLGLHVLGKMNPNREYAIFSNEDYREFLNILSSAVAQPFRLSPSLKTAARELADFMQRPPETIRSSERSLIRILCCSILYNLIRSLSTPQGTAHPQLMDEAVRYLQTHYAEPFRAEALVRHMGYSRASLFAQFKRHTGLSPNDFLVRFRIEKARELLNDESLSITKVAAATGFSSPEYFSAVFRRYVGKTPSAYRDAASEQSQ